MFANFRVSRLPFVVAAILICIALAGCVPGTVAPAAVPPSTVAPAGTPLVSTPTVPVSPTWVLGSPTPTVAPAATDPPPSATPIPPLPSPPTATPAPRPTGVPIPSPGSQTPTRGAVATVPPTATEIAPETPQPEAWLHRSTAHYDLYYFPGGPAAKEIDKLATTAEAAMAAAAAKLQAPPNTRIRVYFVNRTFWQGGASYSHNELLLSIPLPERDYTSTSIARVLQHETTHALVEQLLGSDLHKGGLLGEGVAVWTAGGHYQTEPLDVLASTLVLDNAALYLPLSGLRADFYGAQHEIAYLEGGAYVKFLVERWGLPMFKRYLAQPDDPQPIYGLDSVALEQAWRGWLAKIPHTPADSEAVRLRVRYYDLMRRYETGLDRDARLLPGLPPSAWGPSLIRVFHAPAAEPQNVALERTFVQAGAALWRRDLPTCARLLDRIAAQIP